MRTSEQLTGKQCLNNGTCSKTFTVSALQGCFECCRGIDIKCQHGEQLPPCAHSDSRSPPGRGVRGSTQPNQYSEFRFRNLNSSVMTTGQVGQGFLLGSPLETASLRGRCLQASYPVSRGPARPVTPLRGFCCPSLLPLQGTCPLTAAPTGHLLFTFHLNSSEPRRVPVFT